MAKASQFDIDCLVEVHDEDEMKRALDAGANIIGINNRNLKTFDVSLNTSLSHIPQLPDTVVTVAESGIANHSDIELLRQAGADAVLIGETFMRADDVQQKVKDVMYGTS
jgi:indole-3-glycerol phosphate synthase